MSGFGPRRVAALLLTLALLAAGCATLVSPPSPRPSVSRLPAGRVLVVGRVASEENRPVAQDAAVLLLGALRGSADVLGAREFLSEAEIAGLGVRAPRLLERVERGGWPDAGEAGDLLDRAGVTTLVAVQVTTYDQVWAETGKVTRVDLEAQAFHVPSREVVWQARGAGFVEKERGRAFRLAMESAVLSLAQSIQPAPPLPSVSELARAVWPWSNGRRW
jgi:hypothetical protein